MSCFKGNGNNSASIEKQLKEDSKEVKNEVRCLLLGAGQSGKSTVFKQIKINYLQGFTEKERQNFKSTVYSNILRSIKTLIDYSFKFEYAIETPENRERAATIKNLSEDEILEPIQTKSWNAKVAETVIALWADPAIQQTFGRRNEYQLEDNTEYYMSALDRIGKTDYTPTEQDVVRCRLKTTGIAVMSYVANNKNITFVDVGGQRNERKKWIHCFEDCKAVIFVVSLSEYDQRCYEDDETNRMKESLLLFDEICGSRWFAEIPIILFLNKIDIFKMKIQKQDLKITFKDYTGGNDFEKALAFLTKKFLARNKNSDRKISVFTTCATDTEGLKGVFGSVSDLLTK
jgi:guanine nucleotide-binding protein G(i) subunit alpha